MLGTGGLWRESFEEGSGLNNLHSQGRRDLSARKIPREDLGQQVCDRGFGFIIDQVDDPTQQATPFYEHSLNLPILSIKFRNLLFYGIIPKYAGQHSL